jgi:acyl carrier protein
VQDKKIKTDVKNIFFEVFPKLSEDEFEWEKEQKDYDNWDSFAQLNIITFAESKFDITFSLDESIEIKSANDLLNCINSHLK